MNKSYELNLVSNKYLNSINYFEYILTNKHFIFDKL